MIGKSVGSDLFVANQQTYLLEVSKLCWIKWPNNRTVNIVCHGHSVPAGYFAAPEVRSLEAYPHLLRIGLSRRFPHSVINVIVTGKGGETSEEGAKRFDNDVITHRPDIVTIDYGLNDRGIGLERARKSWQTMIAQAQARGIKVLLITPTADLRSKLDDPRDDLCQHAEQIRELARKYHVGLVDSLAAFQEYARSGGRLSDLMSHVNHPNRQGHELVAERILAWFLEETREIRNGAAASQQP
jgi:acyl-CoA thioesterase I